MCFCSRRVVYLGVFVNRKAWLRAAMALQCRHTFLNVDEDSKQETFGASREPKTSKTSKFMEKTQRSKTNSTICPKINQNSSSPRKICHFFERFAGDTSIQRSNCGTFCTLPYEKFLNLLGYCYLGEKIHPRIFDLFFRSLARTPKVLDLPASLLSEAWGVLKPVFQEGFLVANKTPELTN